MEMLSLFLGMQLLYRRKVFELLGLCFGGIGAEGGLRGLELMW